MRRKAHSFMYNHIKIKINMGANLNENKRSSLSQNKLIMDYLQSGHSITQMDALRLFQCSRLASRINDLKNRGVQVRKEMIELQNGKRVAKYFL